MEQPRTIVRDLVAGVVACDLREDIDQVAMLRWIDSGAPLWRTAKPAMPKLHLCVYFVVFDPRRRTVLLIDHVLSGLRLPPGGHVDYAEDPRKTVVREAEEELGIDARFLFEEPLFVTVTQAVDHSHEDATLWFVLTGDQDMRVVADPGEISAVHWVPLDDDCGPGCDPRLDQFRRKLIARLS
jgi:8-oxo-dGTP pyrophosphatase MutT (NUDIX family)